MSTSINFARVKDIESAANRSKTKFTELNSSIGTLANLTTTNKSSVVEAINELGNSPNVIYSRGFISTTGVTWANLENSLNSGVFSEHNQVNIIADSLDGIEGTIFEGISLNSIITLGNNSFDIYIPTNNVICIVGNVDINSYLVYRYIKSNNVWEKLMEDSGNKKVLFVFDAGYGETLPTYCIKGQKFLLQESGYTKVYTAITDNVWDSGFRLYTKGVSATGGYTAIKYINFYGNVCFKFTSTSCAAIEIIENPLKDVSASNTGLVIQEAATGDTYAYNGQYFTKTSHKIRRVTDIITQIYNVVPSQTNAPAEDEILMINNSYKRTYRNTNTTTRWKSSGYSNMLEDVSYLSLNDKRIFSNEDKIFKFAPLLDGEMFFYEGDKSYYIYRYETQSFEKVATNAATLTATMV